MACEKTEPTSNPPLEDSAIPLVEDPKDQKDNSLPKKNVEVSEIVEAQSLHQEVAAEDGGSHANVNEVGAEVGAAEGEITELKTEAGVTDPAEAELRPPGSEAGEHGTEYHAEIKAVADTGAGAGAGAVPDSQAENDREVTAERESEADYAGPAEADSDEEAEKPHKLTVDDIKTAPMDFRFPTTNQAKHCFTRYVEYHKCVQAKGDDSSDCNKYARYYRSLCPGEWVDRWNEQRENGTFPGPL